MVAFSGALLCGMRGSRGAPRKLTVKSNISSTELVTKEPNNHHEAQVMTVHTKIHSRSRRTLIRHDEVVTQSYSPSEEPYREC